MYNVPEHPDIASALRTGYPAWMHDDFDNEDEPADELAEPNAADVLDWLIDCVRMEDFEPITDFLTAAKEAVTDSRKSTIACLCYNLCDKYAEIKEWVNS